LTPKKITPEMDFHWPKFGWRLLWADLLELGQILIKLVEKLSKMKMYLGEKK